MGSTVSTEFQVSRTRGGTLRAGSTIATMEHHGTDRGTWSPAGRG